MSRGIFQYSQDIINDSSKSTKTTYSSNKIEDLLSNAEVVFYKTSNILTEKIIGLNQVVNDTDITSNVSDLKIGQLIYDTDEILGRIVKIDTSTNKVTVETIHANISGGSSGGTSYTSKLIVADWNASTKQQTITFSGYKDTYNGVIGVPSTATDLERKEYADCVISIVSQAGDQVTLQAETIPTIDLPVAIYCGGGSGSTGGGHVIVDSTGTSLPQEDKLQFKGAKVTDDSTNNVTIVEPEELADADIDDVVSAVPNVTRPCENYTKEEQLIGKWYDGSDLYRRIYTYTANGSNSWYSPNIGLTLASINAKEITKMYGICKNPSSSVTLTIPYNDVTNHVWIQFESSGNYFVNTTLPWDHTVIIEYTKN